MINNTTLIKLAQEKIKNAPNRDWKERGGCVMKGTPRLVPVTLRGDESLGTATVAFFKFKNPLVDTFRSKGCEFIGFTLSVMKIKNKIISETRPVIGKIRDEDYGSNGLEQHFCPQCHSVDSITSKSRRSGPECIHITYKCRKCSYVDYDAFD